MWLLSREYQHRYRVATYALFPRFQQGTGEEQQGWSPGCYDVLMKHIEQYKKWFVMNSMDFEILWMNGKWTVSAWPANANDKAYGWSGQMDSLEIALHACYVDAKRSLSREELSPLASQ